MYNKGLILLVEDCEELNDANSRALTLRGYNVATALTLAEARLRLLEEEPDIILLDVGLPDGDGMDFCKEIRSATMAHILFLTAKAEHEDTVRGLYYGGDDYLTKPFHPEELLARIESIMRRRALDKKQAQTITRGTLVLDIVATQAFVEGEDLLLTPKEFSLLVLLAQNEEVVLSADFVYESVWKAPLVGDKNSMQAIVSKLRQKLEDSAYSIDTVRGKGYVFRLKD